MKRRKFEKLTRAEQRVALAKDALKWLKSGVFYAEAGSLFENSTSVLEVDPWNGDGLERDVQPILLRKLKEGTLLCRVCMRGALFLSSVIKNNNCIASDIISSNGMADLENPVDQRLQDHFSYNQIALIEAAFEGDMTDEGVTYDFKSKNLSKATDFYNKYEDDRGRMEAILKNIIKNNGTFKP